MLAINQLPPGEREWAQTYRDCGYDWCRPCGEWHRPPECNVDETGLPLAPCGCTWEETAQPGYYDQPCRHDTP